MARIAINGFGRIGRQSFKAMLEHHLGEFDVVAVNDLSDPKVLAHLLRYDSTYGRFAGEVTVNEGNIIVDHQGHTYHLTVTSERDPANLPWKDMGVDIVIEATGRFTEASKARAHLTAGAKKVIISAPAKGEDLTIVLGVNEEKYDPDQHHILSNASCTTNCLAPVAKVVNDHFGIKSGLMTTIHAYTMDQNLQDNIHPKDLRRARAAAINMVPTSTGAAQAVALVIPELKGKFNGFAMRVPTPTVSVVDFTMQLEKGTTVEEMNAAFVQASESEKMKGYLGVSTDPVVSTDFTRDARSSIVDLPLTINMGDNFFKVVSWYDNEWGYSVRVGDLVSYMLKKM
ncbi:MAG: type I glyceraldehyde-3-phosphate dehydrogenase [Chloroflexaceae bacterium]|nr:type I glyceraldehyde-3-phosphate dehydrogenase [Chloroflexaceae bacterium]